MKTNLLLKAGLALSLIALSGWNAQAADAIDKGVAVIHPLGDGKVSGTVTFTKEGDNVKVVADLEGLTAGKHGFHIHEFGDCSSPDGKSAGGHFNPGNDPHAGHEASKRHMGDLGNIEADAAGNAHLEVTDDLIKLDQILGRAVIVHEKADDLKTQPSGDAGGRVGCGVIGVAKK